MYILSKGFKFQSYAYNGCHDLLMMAMNLSDIAVLNIIIIAVSSYIKMGKDILKNLKKLADIESGKKLPL